MPRIKEESEELRENRQHAAEDVEDSAAGVVGAAERSSDALQPCDGIPPVGGNDHRSASRDLSERLLRLRVSVRGDAFTYHLASSS